MQTNSELLYNTVYKTSRHLDRFTGKIRLTERSIGNGREFRGFGTCEQFADNLSHILDFLNSSHISFDDRAEGRRTVGGLGDFFMPFFSNKKCFAGEIVIGHNFSPDDPHPKSRCMVGPERLTQVESCSLPYITDGLGSKLRLREREPLRVKVPFLGGRKSCKKRQILMQVKNHISILPRCSSEPIGSIAQNLLHIGTRDQKRAYESADYNDGPFVLEGIEHRYSSTGQLYFPTVSVCLTRYRPSYDLDTRSGATNALFRQPMLEELFVSLRQSNGWPIRTGVNITNHETYLSLNRRAEDALNNLANG